MASAMLTVPHQEEPIFLLLPDFSREEVADFLTSLYHGLSLQPFTDLTSTLGLTYLPKEKTSKTETQVVVPQQEKQVEQQVVVDDPTSNKHHAEEKSILGPQLSKRQPGQKGVGKKKRSIVWEHFIKQDVPESTVCICKHCSKEVTSHGGSTSAMTAHLKRHHSQVGFITTEPSNIICAICGNHLSASPHSRRSSCSSRGPDR